MGERILVEERFYPRYLSVSKTFRGSLYLGEVDLNANVLDVSRDGLGVLLPENVGPGETVALAFGERKIHFQVAHCREDLIYQGKFRCGLRRTGSTENLVSLFRANGFLEES